MFRKTAIYIFILYLAVFCLPKAFAYDEQTTHPALTDQAVEFYNLLHPDKSLTAEEKGWIIEGSILEDT